MYILPNFQNPAGVTLSEARRHQLIFLADKYGIPIIEDDPYGQLRYEGEHLAPLVVLDRKNLRRDNTFTLGNVIYLSTFSKTLAPGIRLAWIVAPPDVVSKLVMLNRRRICTPQPSTRWWLMRWRRMVSSTGMSSAFARYIGSGAT